MPRANQGYKQAKGSTGIGAHQIKVNDVLDVLYRGSHYSMLIDLVVCILLMVLTLVRSRPISDVAI